MAAASMRDVENFGSLQLPLGGKNKYKGVRKVRNDQYQGYTPKKGHTTKAFSTAHEAAVALALKQQNVLLDFDDEEERKPRASRKKRARSLALLAHHLFSPTPSCVSMCLFGSCLVLQSLWNHSPTPSGTQRHVSLTTRRRQARQLSATAQPTCQRRRSAALPSSRSLSQLRRLRLCSCSACGRRWRFRCLHERLSVCRSRAVCCVARGRRSRALRPIRARSGGQCARRASGDAQQRIQDTAV